MSITSKTDFFLDFQRFGELKLDARAHSKDAAVAVAQQFEGLFVQQMLAAMRSAAKIDGSQNSSYMEFYREMYDKQLAQTIAGEDRLGMSKLIMRHMPEADRLNADADAADAGEKADVELQMPTTTLAVARRAAVAAAPEAEPLASVKVENTKTVAEIPAEQGGDVVLSKVSDNDFAEVAAIERANQRWLEPQQFVADVMPEATRAADRLGISAELLVAQAALETGWGKHTMKFDDGRSSYNLFGIKASTDWNGSALAKSSLEYRDGALASEVSRFRAYTSPAQSFDDYVDFIQSSPRYQDALRHDGNDETYIRAIQDAGYATDPQYADKVIGILNGELMTNTLASLNSGVSDHA